MPSHTFRVVVATRDSARWIDKFLAAYRQIAVEPLYLVDERSTDETVEILEALNADYHIVSPSVPRVEGMLAFIPDLIDTTWALRLDDDEFPSVKLLDWLTHELQNVKDSSSMAISRRDCLLQSGKLVYSRWETLYWSSDPFYLNPHWRIFKPREVAYTDQVHTAGFVSCPRFVPAAAYFIHLDWIIRTYAERLRKVANYERQQPGAGYKHNLQVYLPELSPPGRMRLTHLETTEFDDLVESLSGLPPHRCHGTNI